MKIETVPERTHCYNCKYYRVDFEGYPYCSKINRWIRTNGNDNAYCCVHYSEQTPSIALLIVRLNGKVWEVFRLKMNENGYYDMYYKEEFVNIYINIEDAIEWAVSFYSHYGIVSVAIEPLR